MQLSKPPQFGLSDIELLPGQSQTVHSGLWRSWRKKDFSTIPAFIQFATIFTASPTQAAIPTYMCIVPKNALWNSLPPRRASPV